MVVLLDINNLATQKTIKNVPVSLNCCQGKGGSGKSLFCQILYSYLKTRYNNEVLGIECNPEIPSFHRVYKDEVILPDKNISNSALFRNIDKFLEIACEKDKHIVLDFAPNVSKDFWSWLNRMDVPGNSAEEFESTSGRRMKFIQWLTVCESFWSIRWLKQEIEKFEKGKHLELVVVKNHLNRDQWRPEFEEDWLEIVSLVQDKSGIIIELPNLLKPLCQKLEAKEISVSEAIESPLFEIWDKHPINTFLQKACEEIESAIKVIESKDS